LDATPRFGVDDTWVYDDVWLSRQPFYEENSWLWNTEIKRGFGWYAWKPFLVLDAFKRLKDGDIVLFTDADTYPIQDLTVLYNYAQLEGMMLFAASAHNNRQWCKRDTYVVMNLDEEKYHNAQAGVARFFLFRKGCWLAEQFLMEWLAYCVNPLCQTTSPSVLKPELDGFIEHRFEQAILTLLAHKYGIKLYREACDAGEAGPWRVNDRELYTQLFIQDNPRSEATRHTTPPITGSHFFYIRGEDK
jgi:hypothetical protein